MLQRGALRPRKVVPPRDARAPVLHTLPAMVPRFVPRAARHGREPPRVARDHGFETRLVDRVGRPSGGPEGRRRGPGEPRHHAHSTRVQARAPRRPPVALRREVHPRTAQVREGPSIPAPDYDSRSGGLRPQSPQGVPLRQGRSCLPRGNRLHALVLEDPVHRAGHLQVPATPVSLPLTARLTLYCTSLSFASNVPYQLLIAFSFVPCPGRYPRTVPFCLVVRNECMILISHCTVNL